MILNKIYYAFLFSIFLFFFFRLSVEVGKNHIATLAENNQYRADLEKYLEWCNKKGFKIEKRDIRLLQESILKSDNK